MTIRMPDGQMLVERQPEAPWWRPVARRNQRACPLPDPQPGELYVQYAGERDPWGNIRLVLWWHERWAKVGKSSVTAGTLRCQAFLCDERPLFLQWLVQYQRVIEWPSGADMTETIREML